MKKSLDAILVIIIINGLFYLVTHVLPGNEERMIELFGLYFPLNDKFKIWQLVTNMFMHGGLGHILFNMYALWAFGTPLEKIWGIKRFVIFYFAAGLGAGVIYVLVNYLKFNSIYKALAASGVTSAEIDNLLRTGEYNELQFKTFSAEDLGSFYNLYHIPAVGASGAIYGILVAFAMLFPNAKLALIFLPVPIAAKYFIPILIALDLFSGVTGFSIFGGGIAHFAHVGGAIIGFLLMWIWRTRKPPIAEDNSFV